MERTLTAEKAIQLVRGFAIMTMRETANIKYSEESSADWGYLNFSEFKRRIKKASKEELELLVEEMVLYSREHKDQVSRRCTSIVRDNIALVFSKGSCIYEKPEMII